MVRILFAQIFTWLIYISGFQPELQTSGGGSGVTATGPRIHLSNKDCHFDLLYLKRNAVGIMDFVSTVLYRVAQKERMLLEWVVVGRVSFFGVTSNQKSTFENLVQSRI